MDKRLKGEVFYMRCPHVKEDSTSITYALHDYVGIVLCDDCKTSLEHAIIMNLMSRFAQNIGYSLKR